MPQRPSPADYRPKERLHILRELIDAGTEEHRRSSRGLLFSALTAGLEVGFSVMLMAVLWTLYADDLSPESMRALLAAAYPLGFLLVVIGRSELFTEHTNVALLPALHGRASGWSVLRVWAIVLAGNLMGGWVFALAMLAVMPSVGSANHEAFAWIARHMADADLITILGSAVFAGWLMGLLSWMVAASQETLSRMAMVVLVTGIIGLAGLHHSIVGNVELTTGVLLGAVPLGHAVLVEIVAVIGNLIGGAVLVALVKYAHASPDAESAPTRQHSL